MSHEKVLVASNRIIIAQAHHKLLIYSYSINKLEIRKVLPISMVSFEILFLDPFFHNILDLLRVVNLGEIDHSRCCI